MKISKKSIIFFVIPVLALAVIFGYMFFMKGSYCDGLIGHTKEICYIKIISGIIEKQTPESCNKIINKKWKKECFSEVAPEITDPKKCEEFKDEDNKNSCYISVSKFYKDISYCDKVTGERKYACFNAIGIATNNENLCETNSCILTVAKAKRSPNICKKISEINLRYNEEDVGNVNPRDFCLMQYAIGLSDEQVCFDLKNQDNKNSCFRDVAIISKDITLCRHIKDISGPPIVTECKIINGEKICEAKKTFLDKTDEFKILNCYSLIANEKPSECEKVREDSLKLMNACYYKISKINKNQNVCKNIEIPNDRDVTCQDYLNSLNYKIPSL